MGDSLSYLDNLLSTYINQVSIAKKVRGSDTYKFSNIIS